MLLLILQTCFFFVCCVLENAGCISGTHDDAFVSSLMWVQWWRLLVSFSRGENDTQLICLRISVIWLIILALHSVSSSYLIKIRECSQTTYHTLKTIIYLLFYCDCLWYWFMLVRSLLKCYMLLSKCLSGPLNTRQKLLITHTRIWNWLIFCLTAFLGLSV